MKRLLVVLLGLASLISTSGCADLLGVVSPSPPAGADSRFVTQTADITMLFDPWYTAPQLRQAAAALAQNLLPSTSQAGYLLTDADGDGDSLEAFYGGKAPPPAPVPSLAPRPVAPADPTGPVARQYALDLKAWKAQLAALQERWRAQNAASTHSWEQAQAAVLNGFANRWSRHGPEDMCCEDWLVGRGIQHAALSYQSQDLSDPATISGHVRICIVFSNLGQLTPTGSLPDGLLAGVHVLLVNYEGPTPVDAWKRYFGSAGVREVTVVPTTLTDAELPADLGGLLRASP